MTEYSPIFTRLSSPLRPWAQGSIAAILRDKDLSGGFRVVDTIEDRNNIPEFNELLEEKMLQSNYRREGMLCYVVETNITYRLTGDLTNEEWMPEHQNIGLTFLTRDLMDEYLLNPHRYAGQMATCNEEEGKLFVLSNSKNDWLLASANQEHHDKNVVYAVNHKLEETIEHNLGKTPAVQIFNTNNKKCIADIDHIDNNTTKIKFFDYFSGKITFN